MKGFFKVFFKAYATVMRILMTTFMLIWGGLGGLLAFTDGKYAVGLLMIANGVIMIVFINLFIDVLLCKKISDITIQESDVVFTLMNGKSVTVEKGDITEINLFGEKYQFKFKNHEALYFTTLKRREDINQVNFPYSIINV